MRKPKGGDFTHTLVLREPSENDVAATRGARARALVNPHVAETRDITFFDLHHQPMREPVWQPMRQPVREAMVQPIR